MQASTEPHHFLDRTFPNSKDTSRLNRTLTYQIGAIVLVFTAVIILLAGASSIEVVSEIISGAFRTPGQFACVIATLAPLLICSCGLLFTFTARLYNLGIEGQIAFAGIATTLMLRLTQDNFPPAIAPCRSYD